MMKILFLSVFLIATLSTNAQSITGKLTALSNQKIKLEGFNGFKTYGISEATADDHGNFSLQYSPADYGVGYLISSENKPYFVILSGEDIEIKGEALSMPETIRTLQGQENIWFTRYAIEHPRREQALSAWIYLENFYRDDSLFAAHKRPKKAIKKEKQRIKKEDQAFLTGLPTKSYVSWYLPVRKLVSSVSTIAQYRSEEIPSTISQFRSLDYTSDKLYKSGLLKDAVESHFWLIENSGNPLDTVFAMMKVSIDTLVDNLAADEKKFNEITDFLFDLLERHSLLEPAEYLALKVLNETSCTVDDALAKQLETYRAMKKGNIAADIEFTGDILQPGRSGENPQRLSEVNADYIVVVFGSSWCPKCGSEIPKIADHYAEWKKQGVEVVFISLDEYEAEFKNFAGNFPFLSMCDYEKWDTKPAKDYYVFSTPTMFLLDRNLEILLRPKSVKQMDAWVDWFLVQGNLPAKE